MLINEGDMKLALPISSNFDFARLSPDIRRAQLKYLKPILGSALHDELDADYNAAALSAEELELMKYIHPVLAHLAFWLYIPKGNVYVGDNGIQAVHSDDAKPAFEWQKQDFENSMQQNGFDALDELIGYLEEVAVIDFPDWLLSEGCTLVRENFVNTAKRFTEFVPKLKGSRYLFSYLKPIQARIEKSLVVAMTGKAQYEELKSQIKSDSLSANNIELMEMIEPAVTHATWANALFELGIQVDAEGVHLLNNSFSGTTRGKQMAEPARIRVIKEHHEGITKDFMKQLYDYLVVNVTDYPLFASGETYDSDDTNPQFENDADSGVVAFF